MFGGPAFRSAKQRAGFVLSEATILELQQILVEEFNIEYSKSDVDEIASSLVDFIEILAEANSELNEPDAK